jgi:hypothetical protein
MRTRTVGSYLFVLAALGGTACGVAPAPTPDATPDATRDANTDIGADVRADATPDATLDATSMDAAPDAAIDAAPDAAIDAAIDSGPPSLFTDYLGCRTNADCPAGTGECITSVTLGLAALSGDAGVDAGDDAGARVVSVGTLFPGRATPGVCARDCTLDARVCETLAHAGGEDAGALPYVCQVVAVGESPYPSPAPAFPFAVSSEAMAAGVPFAALCRPRFGADSASAQRYCASCTSSASCGDGACWSFRSNGPVSGGAQGHCMPPCGLGSSCPSGSVCRESAGRSYCFPTVETCGACRDVDLDGRGVGHCAARAVDCDDRDPLAYFGATDACGASDRNCNGAINENDAPGCTAYYVDQDGDSWGEGSARCTCGPSGLWTATRVGDCDGSNRLAYPASVEWSTSRTDMNCDLVYTRRYTGIAYCDPITCLTLGTGVVGWNLFTGAEPQCGESGQWGGCDAVTRLCTFGPRTQQCQ